MNTNRLCKDIKDEFKPHGVKLDFLGVDFIERYGRAILEVELKKGTTIKRFFARAPEVRHALHLELFYPFQEGTKLYIALSDRKDITVDLRQVLQKSLPAIRYMKAPYAVGETISGKPYLVDICKLPHLIIAGASNTGKSAALRSLILSSVYNRSVDDVVFFLIDTGANSLSSIFSNLSHLGYNPVKDKIEAAQIFLYLETLLNERIARTEIYPVIICVVDESTSLIQGINDKVLSTRVKQAIETIFQRGRHAGIHMIWATQDPTYKSTHIDFGSVDSRISFSYPQYHQSMAILGIPGAEKLMGKGSMLLKPPDDPELVSLQGSYISEDDAIDLVSDISALPQNRYGNYKLDKGDLPDLFEGTDMTSENRPQPKQEQCNEELCRICLWALGRDQISRSEIMKTFHMSKRANEIFGKLVELGIVDDNQTANQPSAVIPRCVEDIPHETMTFMLDNGIPMCDIQEAVRDKPDSSLSTPIASSEPTSKPWFAFELKNMPSARKKQARNPAKISFSRTD